MTRSIRRPLFTIAALAALFALAGCQVGDSLAGPTWQWTAVQHNPPIEAVAPVPQDYTIEFLTDGTVNIKADCTKLTGTYIIGVPVDVSIHVPTTATAACGDASLDTIFLESLGRVASYATGGGALQLEFADDAGTMQFQVPAS